MDMYICMKMKVQTVNSFLERDDDEYENIGEKCGCLFKMGVSL